MLQLEDELLEKGQGNVRCQGTNGPDSNMPAQQAH
jgi:hypothetical protein